MKNCTKCLNNALLACFIYDIHNMELPIYLYCMSRVL